MSKTVIIAFEKQMAKSSTPATGDDVTVKSNVFLILPDRTVETFNIPIPSETFKADAYINVKGSKYSREYQKPDGTYDSKEIVVPPYQRKAGSISHGFRTIRFADSSRPMSAGSTKYRTASIRFPSWFTILMLSQALGTMLKAHEPKSWSIDGTGKSYPFVTSTEGLVTGRDSGAWVVTTPITSVNTEDAAVGDPTQVVSGKNK